MSATDENRGASERAVEDRAGRAARRAGALSGLGGGQAMRLLKLLLAPRPSGTAPVVSFGFERVPTAAEPAHGGMVKLQKLQEAFGHSPRRFNLLYLGSGSHPSDALRQVRIARLKRARLVWNQNGVAYPAWHGPGWEAANRPLARLLRAADHVIYQSRFCKMSADRFLGPPQGSWEILYNPVDTTVFTPAHAPGDRREIVLLAAGSVHHFYRFEAAVRTLAELARRGRPARLILAGRILWRGDSQALDAKARALVKQLGLEDRIERVAPYAQAQAAAIFRRGHLLLHTQYNDCCPTTVLEAMACGLPVVYSASGGTPELVGEEAGEGVAAPLDWERIHPPDPAALAAAALEVDASYDRYAQAARRRAVERFDLAPYLARHREIFAGLLEKKR